MVKVIISVFALMFYSCSSHKVDRGFASVGENPGLNGTILGVAKTKKSYRGQGNRLKTKTKNMAVRVYARKTDDGKGTYHIVIFQYPSLLGIAPKYILSNKAPKWVNKKVGYLNHIGDRIAVYKAFPTDNDKIYELQKLSVANGQLVAANSEKPSLLKLAKNKDDKNPLEGATITQSKDGEPAEIYIPAADDERSYGRQYALATFVYNLLENFNSTWRTSYLTGDYLGSYGDKEDVVLKLGRDEQGLNANFIINKKRSHLSKKKREKQLTNAKSAYISGKYRVTEPGDGIFVFTAENGSQSGAQHVENRMALFLDVFDASKTKLKQDVVELVFVDSKDTKDFLMYYEHPDNGEGKSLERK